MSGPENINCYHTPLLPYISRSHDLSNLHSLGSVREKRREISRHCSRSRRSETSAIVVCTGFKFIVAIIERNAIENFQLRRSLAENKRTLSEIDEGDWSAEQEKWERFQTSKAYCQTVFGDLPSRWKRSSGRRCLQRCGLDCYKLRTWRIRLPWNGWLHCTWCYHNYRFFDRLCI